MEEDDAAAGLAALAVSEALLLSLLERGLLDVESLREMLESAGEAACQKNPALKEALRRDIDRIVQQTYAIEAKPAQA